MRLLEPRWVWCFLGLDIRAVASKHRSTVTVRHLSLVLCHKRATTARSTRPRTARQIIGSFSTRSPGRGATRRVSSLPGRSRFLSAFRTEDDDIEPVTVDAKCTFDATPPPTFVLYFVSGGGPLAVAIAPVHVDACCSLLGARAATSFWEGTRGSLHWPARPLTLYTRDSFVSFL